MANQTSSEVISFKERATADPVKPLNDLLVKLGRYHLQKHPRKIGNQSIQIAQDLNPVVGLSGEATMTLGTIILSVKADIMTKIV